MGYRRHSLAVISIPDGLLNNLLQICTINLLLLICVVGVSNDLNYWVF
jgi:hypothetical protein